MITDAATQLAKARSFVAREMPGLCERLGLCGGEVDTFHELFFRSLEASAAVMDRCCNNGMVEPIPEARTFVDFMAAHTVAEDSRLIDTPYLEQALEFARSGGNVLVVSNHTSGADTLVLDHLVNQGFRRAADAWAYMAGHVVNLFIIPLAISGAWRRIQIFSAKYRALAADDCDTEAQMATQNRRAMRDLMTYARAGGRIVTLYPEGGRGENGDLLEGEPKTTAIHKAIAKVSPHGFVVLPSRVFGATNILPVQRGPDEFSQFLTLARRGTSHIRFGRPIPWEEMAPTDDEVATRATMACDEGQALPTSNLHSIMFNRMVCSRTMAAIRAIQA